MAYRKRTNSRSRRTSSSRVRSGTGRSGRSFGRGSYGVRRGRSTTRAASRTQTVRIVVEQPGSNPLARPDLLGLGLVKNEPRKPL